MKKSKSNVKTALNFLFAVCCFYFVVSVFSCSTKEDQTTALLNAVVTDTLYIKTLIADNTSSGFVKNEKGQKDTLVMIARYLKNHQYQDVVAVSNEYFNRYGTRTDVKFMLATALFQQSEYAKAARHFTELLNDPEFTNKRMTKYYLAHCYLGFDTDNPKVNQENAKKLLKQLMADPGDEFQIHELEVIVNLIS